MLHMFSVSAQTWQSSNEQRKLRHVGTVHKSCDGCQKSTTGYMATLNPFETTAAGRMVGICGNLTLFFCLTFQGTNAQTTATPCSYTTQLECIHFCLSRINLACGSTVEPLKKKHDGEFADIHLGCVEITYHFSHHIFRTKVAINLDSNSPSSVCGTSAPAAPDRTMTLYVYTYICVSGYQQIYIQMSICICIYTNIYIYIYVY
jgi:hypothetical protein